MAVLVVCGMSLAGLTANAVASEPCPNVGSSGFRAFLPDCRAYELVSPPFKDGFGPEELRTEESEISSNGEHILMSALSGFAGTENDEQNIYQGGAIYEASRTPTGWSTEALDPSAEVAARSTFVTASSDLSSSLWELSEQAQPGEEIVQNQTGLHRLYLRETGGGEGPRFVEVGAEDGPSATQRSFVFDGASHNLSTIVFNVSGTKSLWPGDKTRTGPSLYEYVGTHQQEPTLVGVRNDGPLVGSISRNEHAELVSRCGIELGSGTNPEGSAFNAVSEDGAIVYFTALHGSCEEPAAEEVYARIEGAHTLAISQPAMTAARERECTGVCYEDEQGDAEEIEEEAVDHEERHLKRKAAAFQGASEDGTKVFFTTEQPLLDVDRDTGNDLYEADVEHGEVTRLVMASKGDPGTDPTVGEHADVVGVARISADGSHVYFLARGLLAGPNANGEAPEAGAYNLYDYDSVDDSTALVAVLMSAAEATALEAPLEAEIHAKQSECEALTSEENTEAAEECEDQLAELHNDLEEDLANVTGYRPSSSARPYETTPDGEYMIFESPRDLTGTQDESTVKQLFEYDGLTDRVVRASVGELEGDGNTSNTAYAPRMLFSSSQRDGAPTAGSASLSVSADGRVFFTSHDPLTRGAVPGFENIYEYTPPASAGEQQGAVSLISPGEEDEYVEPNHKPRLLGVDQSGTDAFFTSRTPLVPRDGDSQLDWYDARTAGGFDESSPAPECGEDCQGAESSPPALPSLAGSALQPGGETAPSLAVGHSEPKRPRSEKSELEKLSQALKACRRKKGKARRACEAAARRKHPVKTAKQAAKARR
jgi:hypothetical protein